MMLELQSLSRYFGGLAAVSDISLNLNAEEITAVIGPNGAGKTTLFSLIAGALRPTSGRILYHGRGITGLPPHRICGLGIARTFQVVRPFPNLTVRDHLLAAALFGCRLRHRHTDLDALLRLTGLTDRADQPARTLTLAGCKRLEIARALATGGELLLLDETMAGLNPEETRLAIELVRQVRAGGTAVLLIEHVLAAVTDLCQRAVVLDRGQVIADGRPREVLADETVRQAYLGT